MNTRSTILLVDDTPDVADILREGLELDGHRVLVAQTVEVGVQILRAFKVALVLTATLGDTDAEPGHNWAGLDRLVGAAGNAPLILYAPNEPERYADYAAHGFAGLLPKPFDLDALVALVAAMLPRGGRADAAADISAAYREG